MLYVYELRNECYTVWYGLTRTVVDSSGRFRSPKRKTKRGARTPDTPTPRRDLGSISSYLDASYRTWRVCALAPRLSAVVCTLLFCVGVCAVGTQCVLCTRVWPPAWWPRQARIYSEYCDLCTDPLFLDTTHTEYIYCGVRYGVFEPSKPRGRGP